LKSTASFILPYFQEHVHTGARYAHKQEKSAMEAALLIQAASNIAGAMAATQYGKFGGMETSRLTEVATIAVRIARAIEAEVLKQP
jgi:hypothetical protein